MTEPNEAEKAMALRLARAWHCLPEAPETVRDDKSWVMAAYLEGVLTGYRAELAADHERALQDAYENGLTQRDGPDELSEEQRSELSATYDKYHANAYGEHVDDISALQCMITQLDSRLSARSARIDELTQPAHIMAEAERLFRAAEIIEVVVFPDTVRVKRSLDAMDYECGLAEAYGMIVEKRHG